MVKTPVWHFRLAPDGVDRQLREYGWAEREQVGTREYVARCRRGLLVSEIERFVYSEKS
ncbi:hypothetical protein [Streptomyces sp. NPDC002547]